jgi:superoxide dismutase
MQPHWQPKTVNDIVMNAMPVCNKSRYPIQEYFTEVDNPNEVAEYATCHLNNHNSLPYNHFPYYNELKDTNYKCSNCGNCDCGNGSCGNTVENFTNTLNNFGGIGWLILILVIVFYFLR